MVVAERVQGGVIFVDIFNCAGAFHPLIRRFAVKVFSALVGLYAVNHELDMLQVVFLHDTSTFHGEFYMPGSQFLLQQIRKRDDAEVP